MKNGLICVGAMLGLWLAGCSSPSGGEWPQFRGPTGQGWAAQAAPPLNWNQHSNITWQSEIPGRGWSSPILYQNRVFLTTALAQADGEPHSLRVLCLDFDSGEIVWNRGVLAPAGSEPKHRKNSHASSTPIAEGGRIYAHFGHMGMACLDAMNGEVIWTQTLPYPPVHGNGSSPILVDDKVIFSCDGASDPFVVALNKETGKVAWKVERHTEANKKFSFSTPLLVEEEGRRTVVSPGSGAVFAYDPDNGEEVWRVDYGQGYSVVPRPVVGHGMVYVASGFDRASVYAIRLGGRGDVTESHVAWKTARGAPLTPSMLLIGAELYFVSDNGIASCVDAKTGEPHWQERVGGDVSASPTYAQGRIYITNERGKTVVVKAGKEFEILAENDLDETTYASCAVVGQSILLRTESRLYRIGAPRGGAAGLLTRADKPSH